MAKVTVKLKIADMEFPFHEVDAAQEEIYRHAAKTVNEMHAGLPKNKGWVAKQEFALIALNLAMENLRMKTGRSLGEEIDRLADLDRRLDDYIASGSK